jgi:hypothetical protein
MADYSGISVGQQGKIVKFIAVFNMSRIALVAFLACLISIMSACAYRLPPFVPPTTELVKIVATVPEQYVVNANMGEATSLNVPHDGRVSITVPPYRSCGVYLFNIIKVRQVNVLPKEWAITVSRDRETVRKVSLSKLRKLPTDQDGYRILKINL